VGENRGSLLTQTCREGAACHHYKLFLPKRCDLEAECANLLQFALQLQEYLSLAVQPQSLRVITKTVKRRARLASSLRRI
jgi:hypothetical protein